MNIQRISAMPSISEESVAWESSSQEARHDGSWHNSDAAQNSIHAARLQASLRTAEIVTPQQNHAQQTTNENPETRKTWKTLCHKAAMIFGLAILPSFACVAAGPIFLLVPASLALLFIVFALAVGKPHEALQTRLDIRRAEVSSFDFRGMT